MPYKKRFQFLNLLALAGLAIGMVGCLAAAFAQPAPTVPTDPLVDFSGFAQSVFDALRAGEWRAFASALAVGAIYAVRRYGSRFVPWLGTDKGGATLALVSGPVLVILGMLATDATWSLQRVFDAVGIGLAAAGGWSVAKKLIAK